MSRKKIFKGYRLFRRIRKTFLIFVVIIFLLIFRLAYLSIYKSDIYKARIENQSVQKIKLNSGRGVIYDRNNLPLTDVEAQKIIIVPKDVVVGNYENVTLIKEATNLNDNEIFKAVQEQLNSQAIEIEIEDINEDSIEKLSELNIIVEEKINRYQDNNLLSHTIGYIKKDDNEGVSGIEKSMEDELNNSNQEYISVFKAGALGKKNGLNIVEGGISKVSDNNRNLKLTIDSQIQKKLEYIVDREENPTSVIVSDVETGEILAMTSRPNFNSNDIAKSLNKDDGQLQNRTISSTYPVGSVFKIVVLFAALENKVVTNSTYYYNCTGSENVGKNEKLNCNNLSGHGIQTLGQVFANSCNTAFYDIAKKVGKDEIYKAIEALSLNQRVDIGINEEINSKIPQNISLSNLSIGQGELEFTPIQINQMTQIIANNGLYKPLKIYDSIVDDSMNTIKKISSSKDDRLISPYTITQIKQLMVGVSQTGTAKILNDLDGGCGVKTGTAQSSLDGKKISHGWVTGFYPNKSPKYAITVLVEGTKECSKSALPIFKDLCNSIK